ncbi:MAG: glycoside hydrolase family 2 protein [Spirochaetaceae bacterium]
MKKININSSWDFAQPEKKNEVVNLPHTWNALDGQSGGNNYFRGQCSYQRTLNIEFNQGERVFIELEGANSICKVLVNGNEIGIHKGGYSTFRFELTESIKSGIDVKLEVKVDNAHYDDVYPLMADFTFMGGLYRDVNVIIVNPVHFDLTDFGSLGVFLHQEDVTAAKAKLRVETLVVGADNFEILSRIIDAKGAVVVEGSSSLGSMELVVENPHLWQGVVDPYMYQLEVDLIVDGKPVDFRRVPVGLRSLAIDAGKGFILNGKVVPLKGVSRHQDRKDIGWAQGEKEMAEDIAIIREMGSNSIRLAHYQHNQTFYDLCDKEGIITWAEIPYITTSSECDTTGSNAISQMTELVKQNINHPSIVMWGVQNEITISGKEDNIEGIVTELNELTKKLDPSRLTAQAQVGHHPDDDSMNTITDVIGYNKYFGWYYDEIDTMATWLDAFHSAYPKIPIGITEYGCEAILMYHNSNPQKSDYSEEYQTKYHHETLQIYNARTWVWGTYVWNMFDFASDLRDEGGVQGMNNKGLVTHDRKTRKDSFYVYQSYWSDKDVLHITSKRWVKRVKGETEVKIITNLSEVELIVNGKSIGFAKPVENSVTFSVKLKKGQNIIVALNGDKTDTIILEGVKKVEESYICQADSVNPVGDVENWFAGDGEEEGDVPELEFPEGYYSIQDKISKILKSPEGEVVLRKHLAAMFEHSMFSMVKSFSIERMAAMKPEMFSNRFLYTVNTDLIKVEKI